MQCDHVALEEILPANWEQNFKLSVTHAAKFKVDVPNALLCWINESFLYKAGQFVGKAGCYAVVASADSATFSLAVNRMAAFRTHFANLIP